jgi:hypothetical protein
MDEVQGMELTAENVDQVGLLACWPAHAPASCRPKAGA